MARGFATGLLVLDQPFAAFEFGGGSFVGSDFAVVCDGEQLLRVTVNSVQQLLLSCRLKDSAGNLLLEITENEWITGGSLPWDLEATYKRVSLRTGARQIRLSLDARDYPITGTMHLLHNGTSIWLDGDGITVGAKPMENSQISGFALVAAWLEVDSIAGQTTVRPAPGFEQVCLLGDPDRHRRLRLAHAVWAVMHANEGRAPDSATMSRLMKSLGLSNSNPL